MWTCPKCQRSFKRKDQQHSCVLVSKESLFAKRPPLLKSLYEKVVAGVKKLGAYREETVPPDTIYFKTSSTFLAVKVKVNHLEVEFYLDHHEEHPAVAKWLQTSKHRFAHVVTVDREEDISKELIGWIEESYKLIGR
jgi:hypothetical protein